MKLEIDLNLESDNAITPAEQAACQSGLGIAALVDAKVNAALSLSLGALSGRVSTVETRSITNKARLDALPSYSNFLVHSDAAAWALYSRITSIDQLSNGSTTWVLYATPEGTSDFDSFFFGMNSTHTLLIPSDVTGINIVGTVAGTSTVPVLPCKRTLCNVCEVFIEPAVTWYPDQFLELLRALSTNPLTSNEASLMLHVENMSLAEPASDEAKAEVIALTAAMEAKGWWMVYPRNLFLSGPAQIGLSPLVLQAGGSDEFVINGNAPVTLFFVEKVGQDWVKATTDTGYVGMRQADNTIKPIGNRFANETEGMLAFNTHPYATIFYCTAPWPEFADFNDNNSISFSVYNDIIYAGVIDLGAE